MKFANVNIQRSKKIKQPFLIAEIGVNYYDIAKKFSESLMDAAKRMITEAINAGVDAVKFQTYKAEKLTSKFAEAYWDLNSEPTTNQYELFKKFDHLEYEEYLELKKFTEGLGRIFLTTFFDEDGAAFFGDRLPAFKIASADLTNYPLLKQSAQFKKPLLLSTGASELSEIWNAVNYLRKYGIKDDQIALLHCVLQYPTQPLNANLEKIKRLQGVFPTPIIIGYSDHVPSDAGML
ncbi:MAG: N-acetylneuraminate synthase family protein, partial [Candidatus Heimdallarchaeota archaeon]|nr:N-acetylneuraminate synthase family protein [Candidatus Heimdallarchaeota archaeon]